MRRDAEDRFKLRPRPPRSRGGARAQTFLRRVHLEVGSSGGWTGPLGPHNARPQSRLGRGFAAARLASGTTGPCARRVVVKARVVMLKKVGKALVAAHLR